MIECQPKCGFFQLNKQYLIIKVQRNNYLPIKMGRIILKNFQKNVSE